MCNSSGRRQSFGPFAVTATEADGSGVLPPKHRKANPRSKGHLRWDLGSSSLDRGSSVRRAAVLHFCLRRREGREQCAV